MTPTISCPGTSGSFGLGKFAVHDMQIRAADGAGGDFHQNLRRVGFRRGHVGGSQRLPRRFEEHGAHLQLTVGG